MAAATPPGPELTRAPHLEQLRTWSGGTRAESTLRAYAAALAAWEAAAGRPVDELDDAALSQRLALLAPSSGRMLVAALRYRARLLARPDPVGPLSDLQRAAAARRAGGPHQVLGVTWPQADAMAAAAEQRAAALQADERHRFSRWTEVLRLRALRDAALVSVTSDALLRIGEAVALDVADVEPAADGSGRLHVRRSKTDPAGLGAVLYLRPETLHRVRTWCGAGWMAQGQLMDGALFRGVSGSAATGGRARRARLSASAARRAVQAWAAAVGLQGRVSGHSLRIGAAQSLVEHGATLAQLQTCGRWRSSDMPAYYARHQDAARGAVAQLRRGGAS